MTTLYAIYVAFSVLLFVLWVYAVFKLLGALWEVGVAYNEILNEQIKDAEKRELK